MKTNIKFKRYINNDPFLKKAIRFYSTGNKHWFLNVKRHREDGPASEWSNGAKEWWLNGESYSEGDYIRAIKLIRLSHMTLKNK